MGSRTIEIPNKNSSLTKLPSPKKDRVTCINSTSKIINEDEQINADLQDQQAENDSSMLEQSQMAGTLKTRDDKGQKNS